jgi:hypothetical protein
MQDRSAFKLNNNVSSKVHCKLTPDVNFWFIRKKVEEHRKRRMSGFPLKNWGNGRLNMSLFMQRLGLVTAGKTFRSTGHMLESYQQICCTPAFRPGKEEVDSA